MTNGNNWYYLSAEKITALEYFIDEGSTIVHVGGNQTFAVQETPQEIITLLSD